MVMSRVAFKLLCKENILPVEYKEITCYLIFDVKMGLVRKYRYVDGGHLTDPPYTTTYTRVVSEDSVNNFTCFFSQ